MFISKKRWKDMERRVAALEKQSKKNDIPPLYQIKLALSEALQNAAHSLEFVPEDSVNGKHFDYFESDEKHKIR